MKKRLFIISFSLLLIFTGCSTNIQGQDLMKGIKAQEIKCKDEVEAENTDITDFAVRLFKANEENGKNTLISPISVMYALAMTANGAKVDTISQMENVLGMPIEELNCYLYSYMKTLPQGKDYKFNLANSIWFTDDERFTVNQDFLQLNADYYGADIYRTPFDNSTIKDINNWVKNKTNNMIPKVLDEISSNAIMYLVNALAFEAEWADIYEENQVRDGEFTLEDGTIQTVEFMRGEEHNYIEDENATGFLKYYKDCKYAFVALLPNESISISDYISTLDGQHVKSLIENKTNSTVYATKEEEDDTSFVECGNGKASMSLSIPEEWEYELIEPVKEGADEFGICFWPEGEKEGKIKLMHYEAWGVCGTGLEEKKIQLGEYSAYQGTYYNKKVWDFISFIDTQGHFVVLNEGANVWWNVYGEEAMSILATVQITEKLS